MKIEAIENEFLSGDRQRIEWVARDILCSGRTHKSINDLSFYAERINELLQQKTRPRDRDYLALVYILVEHLREVKNGRCACSIIEKDMFNSPERLEGILEIIQKPPNREYPHKILSKCLSCGKTYQSEEVEWGHGHKVSWNELSS